MLLDDSVVEVDHLCFGHLLFCHEAGIFDYFSEDLGLFLVHPCGVCL